MATHGCTGIPCAICGPQSLEARIGYGNWSSGWLFNESAGNLTAVFGNAEAQHEPTEAQQLACTEPAEERTARLAADASRIMGTPMRVAIERDACSRTHVMHLHCRSCNGTWSTWADDSDVHGDWADMNLRNLIDAASTGTIQCLCVDGMTPRACLDAYTWRQQHDASWPSSMTRRQIETAKDAWMENLRAKQQEARQKEREQVVCDEQWGEEL
jgi:hypothetical protein